MWKPLVHMYIWPRFDWLRLFWDVDNEQATSWKRKSPKLINSQAEPAPESGVLFLCVATLALKQELIKICLENFLGFSLNFYLGGTQEPHHQWQNPCTKLFTGYFNPFVPTTLSKCEVSETTPPCSYAVFLNCTNNLPGTWARIFFLHLNRHIQSVTSWKSQVFSSILLSASSFALWPETAPVDSFA